MTLNQAKRIMRSALEERGLSYSKLTARTVDFSDLARMTMIFVRIHGWRPDPAWSELQAIARDNSFRIEA